jgi:hypothetical protein
MRRTLLIAAAALTAISACGDDTPTAQTAGTQPASSGPSESSAPSESSESTESTESYGAPDAALIDPGDDGNYEVTIDPAEFTSVVDNPFLPKLPGTVWEYQEFTSEGGFERIRIEVLDETKVVMGVEAIVVHDVVTTHDGELIEDTYDWFAQDSDGNVWYMGEDTTSYQDGVASTKGAWEAGVDGALPGIVMPGDPAVSDTGYRQEFKAGEAEDMGQVIALGGSFTVPTGTYDDIVRTRDWTPLEADVVELKAYARGVGFIHEGKVDGDGEATIVVMTSFTPGPG